MYQVFNQYGSINFDFEKIINDVFKGVKDILKLTTEYDVNLILIGDNEIQEINYQYRNINQPTDVISFELDDEENENYIGDIFISIDAIYRQAEKYGHSNEREFAFLVCHGTLHLLGYDHLTTDDEQEMFSLQDQILNYINYRR